MYHNRSTKRVLRACEHASESRNSASNLGGRALHQILAIGKVKPFSSRVPFSSTQDKSLPAQNKKHVVPFLS